MAKETTPERLVEELLRRAAGGASVLLLDYDGTIADIVARPDLARLPEETRTQLEQLARSPRMRVAIVTGRSQEGLHAVAGRIVGATLAVNGGMQLFDEGRLEGGPSWSHPEAERARPLIQRAAHELAAVVARWPGTIMEDKELTLSVHYRLNPAAREPLEATAAKLLKEAGGALRTLSGKQSFEIQPAIEWDKGEAVRGLLERWEAGPAALFLGDDRIDEPAFAVVHARGGLACRIGAHHEATDAEWTLPSPDDVRRMIGLLVAEIGRL